MAGAQCRKCKVRCRTHGGGYDLTTVSTKTCTGLWCRHLLCQGRGWGGSWSPPLAEKELLWTAPQITVADVG
jgi:hypothetical protein